jgi:hypothetical protein
MAVPPVHAPSDDAALVRALLAGRSVLEPALDLARLRAGRHDLRFDHATGRLVCDDASWSMGSGTESLAALSAWMSAWAKLDAQHRELREAAFTDPTHRRMEPPVLRSLHRGRAGSRPAAPHAAR